MELTDYSCVDFIEIFNNPEPLHQVNEKGLLLWEDLVLKGLPIAMTCGMDLHGRWEMGDQFATFIPGNRAAIFLRNWIWQSAAKRPVSPKDRSWRFP